MEIKDGILKNELYINEEYFILIASIDTRFKSEDDGYYP